MVSSLWQTEGVEALRQALGGRLKSREPLSRHTTARLGGPADLYVEALTIKELRDFVGLARQHGVPYFILGGGSNVLIADAGLRGLVIANRARRVDFSDWPDDQGAAVRAESGVVLSRLARASIERGYANLEWAVGVPGTVGGAVVGNAGAYGGDIARALVSATLLDAEGALRDWTNRELEFGYRTSRLKHSAGGLVVLAAVFRLQRGARAELEARAAEFARRRRHSQPPGATLGSMFKNPPGDYAGRLIEAAGLKGARVGQAQISPVHANFFVNLGGATAADVKALLDLARERVQAQFGIELELEIELVGEL